MSRSAHDLLVRFSVAMLGLVAASSERVKRKSDLRHRHVPLAAVRVAVNVHVSRHVRRQLLLQTRARFVHLFKRVSVPSRRLAVALVDVAAQLVFFDAAAHFTAYLVVC